MHASLTIYILDPRVYLYGHHCTSTCLYLPTLGSYLRLQSFDIIRYHKLFLSSTVVVNNHVVLVRRLGDSLARNPSLQWLNFHMNKITHIGIRGLYNEIQARQHSLSRGTPLGYETLVVASLDLSLNPLGNDGSEHQH